MCKVSYESAAETNTNQYENVTFRDYREIVEV